MTSYLAHVRQAVIAVVVTVATALYCDSAFALRPVQSEQSLCKTSDWIFIGHVVDKTSFVRPKGGVRSNIVMAVERVAHGSPPPYVTFESRGGTANGFVSSVDGYPAYDPGSRFVMFAAAYATHGGAAGGRKMADIDVRDRLSSPSASYLMHPLKWFEIAPDLVVPGEEELAAIWEEHCREPAGDAPDSRTVRPTEKYLQLIPESLVVWCTHY